MATAPTTLMFEGLSTAAAVTCYRPIFETFDQVPDVNFISMNMDVVFNGRVGSLGDRVTFARNATNAEKQAAVRVRLNTILSTSELEAGNTLTNINIQISGLPI